MLYIIKPKNRLFDNPLNIPFFKTKALVTSIDSLSLFLYFTYFNCKYYPKNLKQQKIIIKGIKIKIKFFSYKYSTLVKVNLHLWIILFISIKNNIIYSVKSLTIKKSIHFYSDLYTFKWKAINRLIFYMEKISKEIIMNITL